MTDDFIDFERDFVPKGEEFNIDLLMKVHGDFMTELNRDKIKQEMYDFVINLVNENTGGSTEDDALDHWSRFINRFEVTAREK